MKRVQILLATSVLGTAFLIGCSSGADTTTTTEGGANQRMDGRLEPGEGNFNDGGFTTSGDWDDAVPGTAGGTTTGSSSGVITPGATGTTSDPAMPGGVDNDPQ